MRDLRLYECPENRSCGRHRAGTAKGTEIYGWAGFKLGLYSMRSLFFTGLRLDESPEGQAPQLLTLGQTFLSTRHEALGALPANFQYSVYSHFLETTCPWHVPNQRCRAYRLSAY